MNFDFIKEKYISLYYECLDFIIEPNKGWQKVVDEKRSWTDTQTRLLYPLLALICLLGLLRVFIENFYNADYDFLTQILLAMAWPVLLGIFLIVATLIGRPSLQKYTKKPIEFERMVVFLAYSEIPLLISAAIFALLPFMFAVLIFLNFYSAYVIMSGYNVYFADVMGEEKKFNFPTTLATFIIIYVLTYVAWLTLAKF